MRWQVGIREQTMELLNGPSRLIQCRLSHEVKKPKYHTRKGEDGKKMKSVLSRRKISTNDVAHLQELASDKHDPRHLRSSETRMRWHETRRTSWQSCELGEGAQLQDLHQ